MTTKTKELKWSTNVYQLFDSALRVASGFDGFKVNNTINALKVIDNILYIGGAFTSIMGQSRNRLAAVDLLTYQLLPFNPNVGNNSVLCFENSGSNLYIGGSFTSVGGSTRNRIACVDKDTGAVSAFNPNAGGTVRTLLLDDSNLYLGGAFTTLSGSTINRLCYVDKDSGAVNLASVFNPNVSGGDVYTLQISGSALYLAGGFNSVSGTTRNRVALVNKGTSELDATFNPNVTNGTAPYMFASALQGSNLYLGGDFTQFSGTNGVSNRNRMAVADKDSGVIQSFNPNSNGSINTMILTGSLVYIGGTFTTVSGSSRTRLTAVHKDTWVLQPFNPVVAGTRVETIAIYGSTMFVGGTFTSVSGKSIVNMASVDLLNGMVI